MTNGADLRRVADVVDTFQDDTVIDVHTAQIVGTTDDLIRAQFTVTIPRGADLEFHVADRENNSEDHDGRPEGDVDEVADDEDELDSEAVLDHTSTEDLQRAYDAADGNISDAADRFDVGYTAVYRRMCDHGVHETDADTKEITADDPSDHAPEQITVDGVSDERDDPEVVLPDGVTKADVEAAADDHESLGDLAAELGVTRGRARTITVALGCYSDVRDVPGGETP